MSTMCRKHRCYASLPVRREKIENYASDYNTSGRPSHEVPLCPTAGDLVCTMDEGTECGLGRDVGGVLIEEEDACHRPTRSHHPKEVPIYDAGKLERVPRGGDLLPYAPDVRGDSHCDREVKTVREESSVGTFPSLAVNRSADEGADDASRVKNASMGEPGEDFSAGTVEIDSSSTPAGKSAVEEVFTSSRERSAGELRTMDNVSSTRRVRILSTRLMPPPAASLTREGTTCPPGGRSAENCAMLVVGFPGSMQGGGGGNNIVETRRYDGFVDGTTSLAPISSHAREVRGNLRGYDEGLVAGVAKDAVARLACEGLSSFPEGHNVRGW